MVNKLFTATFLALQALGALAAPAAKAPPIWELDPLIQRIVDVDPTFYDRFIVTGQVDGVQGLPSPRQHRNGRHGPVYPQVVHSEEEYKAYQAAIHTPKAKRSTPRPLWNKRTGTRYTDVKQTAFGDCWLDAVMLSIAWVNPLQWIESVFTLPVPNDPVTDHAVVTLQTGKKPSKWNSTIEDIFSTPDGNKYSDASDLWWPAAIEYAVLQYGITKGEPNILDDGGLPSWSLNWLTGYPTSDFLTDEQTINRIDILLESLQWASTSPVVLGTKPWAKTLVGSHAYAILWAGHGNPSARAGHSDPNKATVLLQNPWGFTLFYQLEDILPDIFLFTYLTQHQNGPPE